MKFLSNRRLSFSRRSEVDVQICISATVCVTCIHFPQAVSGLPVRNEHHAEEIISMACLMLQLYYASEYAHLDLVFRAGAHAGKLSQKVSS